jgi:hypothetical protein
MARPALVFDLDELAKLGALQCTQAEIAAWFGCSERTIVSKLKQTAYRDAWRRGREKGLISLRRTQFRLAERNAAVAIFLGKNYLGQRDRYEHGPRPEDQLPTEYVVIRRVVGGPDPTSREPGEGRPS